MRSQKLMRGEAVSGYLFVAPYVILSVLFMAYPIILQFVQSLYKVKFQRSVFVGLQNYLTIFTQPAYVKSIGNTILFIDVPAGCCTTVAVENTSGADISVQNANLIVTREA